MPLTSIKKAVSDKSISGKQNCENKSKDFNAYSGAVPAKIPKLHVAGTNLFNCFAVHLKLTRSHF